MQQTKQADLLIIARSAQTPLRKSSQSSDHTIISFYQKKNVDQNYRKLIKRNADPDEVNCLRLIDFFYHKEHLIIITELLGENLYEFSKRDINACSLPSHPHGVPFFTMGRVQIVARQILTALEYIHSMNLIHCDLKPENILVKNYHDVKVKIIDFGSSCFTDDHLSSYVQSRSYRAPETILGLPYDQKIDIWSFGCIMAEIWSGYVLFQNDTVQSLLARVVGILGPLPQWMMDNGKYVKNYFTRDPQVLYMDLDSGADTIDEMEHRIRLLIPKKSFLQQRLRTDDHAFLDFMKTVLTLDPQQRPCASAILKHSFLDPGRYPDGIPLSQ